MPGFVIVKISSTVGGEAYSLWHGFAYRADIFLVDREDLSANASPLRLI